MESYLDRIKRVKNEKRITNEQLAALSGVPLGTLSKLLAGMSDSPKLSNMVAICDALGTSLEYIVTGKTENTNNYTLDHREIRLVEEYRTLDSFGMELVDLVVSKEAARVAATERAESFSVPAPTSRKARILPTAPVAAKGKSGGKRSLLLYELPVSAGPGVYLDESRAESILVPDQEKTAEADYALRISGNSMEPRYHSGDILLVSHAEAVNEGEAGIFLLDGSAFFKIYDGDRLLSLNPDYEPISLKGYSDIRCKGRVVGKLKRK